MRFLSSVASVAVGACLLAASGHPALPTSPNAEPETLTWVRCGGPAGGLGYDVRMSPRNPDLMFVTDAFAGVFRSDDGGATWNPSNQGITSRVGFSADAIPVFSLTIDPNDPTILWAGTQNARGIFKSTDEGRTWSKKVNGVQEGDGISFRGFSVQPGDSNTVYAAAEIASFEWAGEPRMGREFDLTRGVVYKTTDGGENWRAVWRGDNLARYIWIDPRDTDVVYVSTGIFDREAANSEPTAGIPGGVGIIKSVDGGATWSQINQGLGNLYVGTLFMHPQDPDILLAGAGNNQYHEGAGVYRTENGGATWQLTLDEVGAQSVEFSTLDPDIAYAADSNSVYRSEDGGRHWEKMTGGPFGWGPEGIRAGFPIDFQIDPRNAGRIFTNNYGGGNFLSEDGGATWMDSSQGYTGAQVRDIAASPQFAGEVYVAARSGLFATADGGLQWEGWNYRPFADLEWNAVAADPADPEHILAANNFNSAILETYDRGRHWRRAATTSMANVSWNAIAFAPSNPAVVYAGTAAYYSAGGFDFSLSASGLYASFDNGRSWTERNGPGFEDAAVTDIAIHPHNGFVVIVSTSQYGLLKSEDGGETWRQANNGLPTQDQAISVAIDVHDPGVVYAGFQNSALYVSRDAGNSWTLSAAGMNPQATVSDVLPDPTRGGTVYASDRRSGVLRSTDSGRSWQLFGRSLANRDVNALALSVDGRHLYAATEGGGMFRLDLEGAPPEPTQHLVFMAQFGDGEGFTSDIVLTNPSPGLEVSGAVSVFDDEGQPLDRLPQSPGPAGDGVAARDFSISPRGLRVLSTEGREAVAAGSAVVTSSSRLGGVIRFAIPDVGIAGVGESAPLSRFIVPVRHLPGQLSTGLALQNPEGIPVNFTISLRDAEGFLAAAPLEASLPPRGHMARFIDQLFGEAMDGTFHGAVEVSVPEGLVTATAMELGRSAGQFTTLPVTPVFENVDEEPSTLYFAQFGDGGGLQSDVVLVNPSESNAVSAGVAMFDDEGSPLEIALTGPESSDFMVPPLGVLTLSTPGEGEARAGSLRIETQGGRLGGVVRYRIGGIGIAGVGESPPLAGFIVPVRRTDGEINTGIAVHNPQGFPIRVAFRLHDEAGQPLENGTALTAEFPANGHVARFIDQIFPDADTSQFSGTLTIQAEAGAITATALELGPSPGEFTTLPVIPFKGPFPEDPADAQAMKNPGSVGRRAAVSAPITEFRILRGRVMAGGRPVAGARVRVQASPRSTLTDPDGRFKIDLPEGLTAVDLTACAESYYIAEREDCRPGEEIEINLQAHPSVDNPDYRWLTSIGEGGDGGDRGCAECHSSRGTALPFLLPVDEWLVDAHSQTARNERFLSMYSGTDVLGNRSPDRKYGYHPDYGRFPLRPDPTQPYFGPGFKLDYPEQAGNCAACHAPAAAVNHPYQTDPRDLSGVFAEGIPCDFCHKVWDVRLDPQTGRPFENRPGVLSFEFRRPPEGRQFFAGPFDDVAPGEDVYSALQTESRFCAPCHFGVFWGVPIYNSFGEWLASPYSDPRTGQTCQDCHMPRTGAWCFARPEKGGLQRDPATIFGHAMPGAGDVDLLREALTLETTARVEADRRIIVEVDVWNEKTGHHVPTGSPLRQVILLVQAWDERGQSLHHSAGSKIPHWGGIGSASEGFYAGLPGEIFAKVLREEWTEVTPAASYWNLTSIVSDNRIAALERRTFQHAFRAGAGRLAVVEVRLLFRRAFIELMKQKGWSVPDVVMAKQRHVLQLGLSDPRSSGRRPG